MKPVTQVALGLAVCVAALLFWLLSPVCVRIPDDSVPDFESVRSLDERAASGEPFEKKDDGWYVCKPRIIYAMGHP